MKKILFLFLFLFLCNSGFAIRSSMPRITSGNISKNLPNEVVTNNYDYQEFKAKIPVIIHTSDNVTLTTSQCRGDLHILTNASTTNVTLPSVSAGLSLIIKAVNDAAMIITLNASDKFNIEGINYVTGNGVASDASSLNRVSFIGQDDDVWMEIGEYGTWTEQ